MLYSYGIEYYGLRKEIIRINEKTPIIPLGEKRKKKKTEAFASVKISHNV